MSSVDHASSADAPPPVPPAAEHFIPWRVADLLDALVQGAKLSTDDASLFRQLYQRLRTHVHGEYQAPLDELKTAYAPFDPDSDTRAGAALAPAAANQRRQALFERFAWLMERGNFVRLAEAEIDHALSQRSHWGLNLAVDFSIFQRLELFCRGDGIGTRYRRHWRNRMRSEAVDVEVYQRLVVIFSLRPTERLSQLLDTDDIHIKLFKDIPKVDLDMLLPGTRVKMSLLDRGKIMLPTLSGLSIVAWKLVQAVFFATTAGLYGALAILGLVGGTLGYGARSFYGYLNTKQKYQLSLTQSLYYLNLDNNAGVIFRLLDEAEEQELREIVLAYFHLWRHAPAEGWTTEELDTHIESTLNEQHRFRIDFEIADAVGKLEKLGLVRQAAGKLIPTELPRANELLAELAR